MEETRPHQTKSSRLGLRHAAGEIVEVQGGHIVRSTGRKDRHSKVCTAKGTRDRRVRLSAHTAIQFYDVQDRLGYDRPSKAVDWLIKKSKAAIDELAELPAWKPPSGSTANVSFDQAHGDGGGVVEAFAGSSSRRRATNTLLGTDIQNQQQQQLQMSNNPSENNPNFLPPSLDSDSFSDTIKSFFPMCVSAEETNSSSPMQFQNFPPPDLLSRTSSQSQNLRLSLQSFQDTILVHHHHQQPHHQSAAHQIEQGFFFETGTPAGWSSDQPAEISRFQRMVAWNAGGETSTGGGGRGFIFNSPQMPPLFVQNQFLSQGGTLQSSNNSPSFRA